MTAQQSLYVTRVEGVVADDAELLLAVLQPLVNDKNDVSIFYFLRSPKNILNTAFAQGFNQQQLQGGSGAPAHSLTPDLGLFHGPRGEAVPERLDV